MAPKPAEDGPSFLTALGSLFGGPKVVRAPFSTYGKLPFYRDFLRHGLAAKEAQALRQWLDRGFGRYWDGDEACRNHWIEPHAFSLQLEGLARRLVGCLWGSSDQGELRRFPFLLFVSLPAGGSYGDLSALAALGTVAEEAGRLKRSLAAAADVQAFYNGMRQAALTVRLEKSAAVRERLAADLGTVSVQSFAQSLYGEEAAAQWPALLAYLGRHRAAVRAENRSARGAPALACRLPVSPLLPVPLQAELWAALLQGPGPRPRAALNVLLPWPGADAPGGLVLFERDLRLDDVFALHPEPSHYDFVEDLRRKVPAEAGTAAGTTAAAAAEPGRPLSSLLATGLPVPAGA